MPECIVCNDEVLSHRWKQDIGLMRITEARNTPSYQLFGLHSCGVPAVVEVFSRSGALRSSYREEAGKFVS